MDDYQEMKDDPNMRNKLIHFRNSITKIENVVDTLTNADIYNELSLKEKVDYDLFMAYMLNTLYWTYLRSKNEDPNKSEVKDQLARVKTYMVRAKQAHERQTIRPKVDLQAAERFVKHGINYKSEGPPPNKKIKFSE